MQEEEAIRLFKCLADKSRLQILKSLMTEDMYAERLAERLSLTPATISFHMKKLEEAGAVTSTRDQYYTMYTLRREVFSARILDVIGAPSDEADAQAQREEAYRQKILQNFFEYGRLTTIPAQRKKWRICLEEIARAFEVGKPYAENEVNAIIERYHEDYCTLRREMICEGIMERSGGDVCAQGITSHMRGCIRENAIVQSTGILLHFSCKLQNDPCDQPTGDFVRDSAKYRQYFLIPVGIRKSLENY